MGDNEKKESVIYGADGVAHSVANEAEAIAALVVTDPMVMLAERNLDNYKKILTLALKITIEYDWVLIPEKDGDRPYLQASGYEKIARLFKLSIVDKKMERFDLKDENGDYYVYRCHGIIILPSGDKYEAFGSCSSRDQFFSMAKGVKKEQAEVEVINIMKAAETNFIVRGIGGALGLRTFSIEQLKSAGLNVEKSRKIGYNVTEKTADDTPEQKNLREEIRKMLLEMMHNDAKAAGLKLQELSKFNDFKGWTSTKYISVKSLNIVHNKVKTAYEKWLKENFPTEGDAKE